MNQNLKSIFTKKYSSIAHQQAYKPLRQYAQLKTKVSSWRSVMASKIPYNLRTSRFSNV